MRIIVTSNVHIANYGVLNWKLLLQDITIRHQGEEPLKDYQKLAALIRNGAEFSKEAGVGESKLEPMLKAVIKGGSFNNLNLGAVLVNDGVIRLGFYPATDELPNPHQDSKCWKAFHWLELLLINTNGQMTVLPVEPIGSEYTITWQNGRLSSIRERTNRHTVEYERGDFNDMFAVTEITSE